MSSEELTLTMIGKVGGNDGIEFHDDSSEQRMFLVTKGWAAGWICYEHPDKTGWVTLREATKEDLTAILTVLADALRHTGFDFEAKAITRRPQAPAGRLQEGGKP